jgi:hypothetical protein
LEADLSDRDGIGDKLRKTISRLGFEARRTSGIAQAKVQLNRLQAELKEREGTLGRKLAQLKRRGAVKDSFLLEALKVEFMALADCEERIQKALNEIHGLAAFKQLPPDEKGPSAERDKEKPSDLDSFEVS